MSGRDARPARARPGSREQDVRRLLLASTSPRRTTLVAALGLPCEVLDPGLGDAREAELAEEALDLGQPSLPGRGPAVAPEAAPGLGLARAVVVRLAVAKLLSALRRAPARPPGTAVIAADTAVAADGRLLGKPAGEDEARAMLWGLRGRPHRTLTGLALLGADGILRTGADASVVRMRAFGEDVLDHYLRQGVWHGKAGGYGEQDPEAEPLIEQVEGSVSNVRGLPVELLTRLLGLAP